MYPLHGHAHTYPPSIAHRPYGHGRGRGACGRQSGVDSSTADACSNSTLRPLRALPTDSLNC